MCFKLDNGSELFSVQDMQKLKKSASGRMGSKHWVDVKASSPVARDGKEEGHGCGCDGKCVTCKCAERRARQGHEAERLREVS
ncbi:hypothetical protein H4684_002883 [Desulfomicrobium macestii]|uniref:Uncharacterized protein n=1 Tax=Desulfomicrobium macestii TaxID=90731 RepID=A0ABR9H685_9BACT|nr:hypothetical protein [Desulfomicrobium macestii]MBE1426219.1 hypothetical protein [Desulfomicrobium macestii]